MEGFKKQEEPFQEHALLNNYIFHCFLYLHFISSSHLTGGYRWWHKIYFTQEPSHLST